MRAYVEYSPNQSKKLYLAYRPFRQAIEETTVPFTAEVSSSMQCLTEVRYVTSDQHKESSKSRIERDLKDTKTVEFLIS